MIFPLVTPVVRPDFMTFRPTFAPRIFRLGRPMRFMVLEKDVLTLAIAESWFTPFLSLVKAAKYPIAFLGFRRESYVPG